MQTIIEVMVGPDGTVDFKIKQCWLNTDSYGNVLASLAVYIAEMFAREGGHDRDEVLQQITAQFDLTVRQMASQMPAQSAPGLTRMQ
jgi:hypothetical protein